MTWSKPEPRQSDQLRAWAHELQPNIVNSRVGNDRADFRSDGTTDAVRDPGPLGVGRLDLPQDLGLRQLGRRCPTYKDTGYPDYTEEDWDHIQQVDNTTTT